MNDSLRPDLDTLAKHLLRRRDAILANWSERIQKEGGLSELALLTRAEFYDHIPAVLNALHAELGHSGGTEDEAARRAATEHGAHRWQQGFDLLQLIRDWGELHLQLLREFERFAANHEDATDTSMVAAREVLAHVIHDGIARSIAEYQRLQRIEAQSRAGDIERMLTESPPTVPRSHRDEWRAASRRLSGSLGVIQEAVESLAASDLDTAQTKSVDHIRGASVELAAMLSSLRDLARLEAELENRTIEPLDAAQLLREAIESFKSGHGLGIEYAGPVSLAVRGDRLKIQRIVQTIVLDLLYGTSVRNIVVRCQADPPRRWSIVVEVFGADLSKHAAGNLAGEIERISEEVQANASAPPDVETKASSKETESQAVDSQASADRENVANHPGVGLAIVRRLCELLDATLEINTRGEQGSTFRIILPREYKE